MGENTTLLTMGNLQVTAYSLCITMGVLLAVLITILLGKKKYGLDKVLQLCIWTIPAALIGGHLVYCLARLSVLLADYQHGTALLLMPWMGGYTLFGSLLGGLLGVFLSDRKNAWQMADLAAPGAMLMLAIARAAEYFTGEGLGGYLEEDGPCFFPMGICTYADEYWSEWRIPVFAWETLAALILFVLAIVLLKKGARPGFAAETVIALMCIAQLLLESLRMDEAIKFGFVRLNQLLSAILLLVILLLRMLRKESVRGWQIARVVMFVLAIGGIIAIEFGLDKSSIDNLILYAVMVVMQVMIGFALLMEKRKTTC